MPVGFANLTSGGLSGATASYSTASVTPTGSVLLAVNAYNATGGNPAAPTVSGCGLTWTQAGTSLQYDVSGTDRATMFVFVGTGTPTSGAITVTFPAAVARASWVVDDVTGAATSPVVQAKVLAGASATSLSTTFDAAFASGSSGAWAAFANQSASGTTFTAGTGWTALGLSNSLSIAFLATERQAPATTTTIAASWSAASRCGVIAVEVAPAAAAGPKTGTAAGAFGGTFTASGGVPGWIAGIEPESHGHNPVHCDSNGNLYKLVESYTTGHPLVDTDYGLDKPAMMKSTNGGVTWQRIGTGLTRPGITDLEGAWTWQDGTRIGFVCTTGGGNDCEVAWFNTSDAASNADSWTLPEETVATGLTGTDHEQYACAVERSTGAHWFFYADALVSEVNQIGYRNRQSGGTYDTAVSGAFGATTEHLTAPAAVLGASDVTHIAYRNSTGPHVYYRSLTNAGGLSSAVQLDDVGGDTTGVTTARISHANPVHDATNDVVYVLYADSSNRPRLARIVPGATPTVTTEAVAAGAAMMDGDLSTNGGLQGHLAIDGTTLYVAWVDVTSGDTLYRTRTAGGTWSAPATLVEGTPTTPAWYVYIGIYTRGGTKRLGVSWDQGPHANSDSDLRFAEVAVTAAAATGQASAAFGGTYAAAGQPRTPGQASGSFGFTGTASGVPRTSGQAAVAFGGTYAAAGIDRALGQAVAQLGFTATATGIPRHLGQAAGSFGFAATTAGFSGSPPTTGQAVAAFGFTATAQGVDRALGQATASFGFTATASGAAGTTGAVSAAFGFTATAAGVDRALGVAVAAFGGTFTAAGAGTAPPAVEGAAAAVFGFTATVAGRRRVVAVLVAELGFTATGRGGLTDVRIISIETRSRAFTLETRDRLFAVTHRQRHVALEERT